MSNSRYLLQDYFTCIGLPADYKPEPTLKCLREISCAHLRSFPYNNSYLYDEGLKPSEDRIVPSLAPDDMFESMVIKGLPVYCYQTHALLSDVLKRVGFEVTQHLGKVVVMPRLNVDENVISKYPDTHIVIKVTIDEIPYIVDTGFANDSLRQPLRLIAGEHKLETDDYLLEDLGHCWRLNSMREKNGECYWYSMFQFHKHPAMPLEIEKAHVDLFHAPNIPIREDLLAFADVTDKKRKFIEWYVPGNFGLFRSVNRDRSIRDEKMFCSEEEVREFAQSKFGV